MVNKSIRITPANFKAIVAVLKEANGKAEAHAYTTYSEIEQLAEMAEMRATSLLGAKSRTPGAVAVSVSGESVAKSYRGTRNGTLVRLERRASGWFLTEARSVEIYTEGGKDMRMLLTKEQDAQAIANLRTRYAVLLEVPQ